MPASIGHAGTQSASAAHKPKRSLHIPALDGIRGLAILLVLIFHFSQVAYDPAAKGLQSLVQRVMGAGWVGVDLFFVLSGFLITSILCEAVGTKGYFKNFYARRTLRIFPLYFGTLLVAFVILPLVFGRDPAYEHVYKDQWALWLYVQNFIQIDWLAFSHFWSLAVEEHFYLVWPAVLFFCGRRGAMVACVLMIAGALAIRIGRVTMLPSTYINAQMTYLWTICRMDSLAIGSLLALAVNGIAADLSRFRRFAPWVLLASIAGCGAMVAKYGSFSYQPHKLIQAVGYTTVAVGAAALLVLTITAKPGNILTRVFTATSLRFLGKYSYGIYVIHSFLHHWMMHEYPLKRIQQMVGSYWLAYVVYVVTAMLLSIGLALLSWHLYEKHFLKLKKYFEYRAPTMEGFKPNESIVAKT
ncbi:acyltransferase family protein [Humisphaera borealis]|uniref:Acyltransferase n=1 Tax=Humisphaera borealis TaxID=2807512 RepID=A0A7M2WT15_9BACT|nr:acyltransferase [Humisphaera borealis]QOV87961.1 acyltransferase [Humisphaera borealis]